MVLGVQHLLRKAMHPQVVFVLGGPGAGKGTQCQKIFQVKFFSHFNTNDFSHFETVFSIDKNFIKKNTLL